jgi:hypothetical protein
VFVLSLTHNGKEIRKEQERLQQAKQLADKGTN